MKELGLIGLEKFRKQLKFGDIVRNYWASDENPNKEGMFIGYKKVGGAFCLELTDIKGKRRWYPVLDKHSKLDIISSTF